jgi:signal transduction histidine kinase
MLSSWDFTRQFSVGMAVVISSVLLTGLIAILGVHQARISIGRVAGVYAKSALAATDLERKLDRRSELAQAFFLTGNDRALREAEKEDAAFETLLPELRARASSDEGRALLDAIDAAELRYAASLQDAIAAHARHAAAGVGASFAGDVVPARDHLATLLSAFEALKEEQFVRADEASSTRMATTATLVGTVAGLSMVVALALAVLLWRGIAALTRGRAVIAASLAHVEQSNRDLDAFAGRVAHDLRGALGPVLAAPQLLRAGGASAERVESVSQRLDRAVERAVGLVDSLLAFSRAGAIADGSASASTTTAVGEVVADLKQSRDQASATISTDIVDAAVRCPPGLLHIVVWNLVGNAVKFVRELPVREVTIHGRVSGSGYELCIDDTGPGIPGDALARIFEPFYRVPGTIASGTGIGLATVRRIIDAYAGRITVRSTLGAGSSFRVWLPLAEERSSEPPAVIAS